MPQISIIVPVYNVEKYLDRCIISILNQTIRDFELILVEDGSPDNCARICDEWARKDDRIKVIHKKNGGLSSARNAGLDIARGEYIGFVDSDDWIDIDMYQILLDAIKKYDVDYSAIEMKIVKNEQVVYKPLEYKETVLDKDKLFKLFFRVSNYDIHYCVCDKLFKRSKLRDIRFKEGIHFEDIDFNFKLFQYCDKAVFVNQKKYYWFYNEGSITRNGVISKDMQIIDVWKEIVKQCKIKYPEYEYFARMNYKRAFMGILGKYVKFGVDKNYTDWKNDRSFLLKHLRKYFIDLIKWKMPYSRKILLCMLCISPKLTRVLFNLFNTLYNKKE